MSHFSVLVICDGGKTVDEMLEPFSENLEVEPYINRTKAEMLNDAKKRQREAREKQKSGKELYSFEQDYLDAKNDEELYMLEKEYDDEMYDEDGNELSTYNPDSRWDWYQIGGRWTGMLNAKKGIACGNGLFPTLEDASGRCDIAIKKDIDFSPNEKAIKSAERFWEVVVEGSPLESGENEDDFLTFYKKEYYLKTYGNKEEYVRRVNSFGTFAVLTADGVWHEKGEMFNFGVGSESVDAGRYWDDHYMELFIDNLDDETVLAVVDCHI